MKQGLLPIRNQAKSLYHFARRALPEKYSVQLDLLANRKVRILETKRINEVHAKNFPDARVTGSGELGRQIFRAYYGEISPDQIIPDESNRFIHGAVPFVRGHTAIYVYNSMDRFYSLRDPVLFRIYLMKEGRVYATRNKVLQGDELMFYIDSVDDFFGSADLPDTGVVVVQVFHPRLVRHTEEFRFFGILKKSDGTLVGASHSLYFPQSGIVSHYGHGFRCYGVNERAKYLSIDGTTQALSSFTVLPGPVAALGKIGLKDADGRVKGMGYYLQYDDQGDLVSLWHDDTSFPDYQVKVGEIPPNTRGFKATFPIPDFATHAPIIVVSRNQLGFRPLNLTFSIFNRSGVLLAERRIERPQSEMDDFKVDTRETFSDTGLKGDLTCVVTLDANDLSGGGKIESQLMVFYRSATGFADQVHSVHSQSRSNVADPKPKSYRCLKFAPLFHKKGLRCLYGVSNAGGVRPNEDGSVTVRVISDRGREACFDYPLPKDGLGLITGEELLEKIDHDIDQSAVVQIEHKTSNYMAHACFINNGTMAIEHFTGN